MELQYGVDYRIGAGPWIPLIADSSTTRHIHARIHIQYTEYIHYMGPAPGTHVRYILCILCVNIGMVVELFARSWFPPPIFRKCCWAVLCQRMPISHLCSGFRGLLGKLSQLMLIVRSHWQEIPQWCELVPQSLPNGSLGRPKSPKIESSGFPRPPKGVPKVAKVPQNPQNGVLRKGLGTHLGHLFRF